MANIPEFISVLRRIRDEIYPKVEEIYEDTATLKSEAELIKIAAAASAIASASSAAASASSAGVATTRANEIKNVSAQANTLSSGMLATVSYNPTDGKFTFGLPAGVKGDKGESYTINAKGTTSGRAAYDTQSVGFSYLDINLSIVYFKLSATSGDWSMGASFGRGEDGADGADGTGITSIAFSSTTSNNGLPSQPGGIDTYRINLSNSNTYDISLANGNDLNINGYGDKTIPKDDDEFVIADSDSYFNLKKLSIRNIKSSINSGFKNYIINGNFDVWQRGTSHITNATINYGSADRWRGVNLENTNLITTQQKVSDVVPFQSKYFIRQTVQLNTATGTVLDQLIEGLRQFSSKVVTLSMWVNGTAGKKIGIGLEASYGTGGSQSTNENIEGSVYTLGGGWEKISITRTLPDFINGKAYGTNGNDSLRVVIFTQAGTIGISPEIFFQSGTFDIAQVQLEEGSVATPFEHRPIGLELSLCQRYYEDGFFAVTAGTIGTGTTLTTNIVYKGTKRIPATIVYSGVTYNGCSNIATNLNTITMVTPKIDASSGGYAYAIGRYTASAEL